MVSQNQENTIFLTEEEAERIRNTAKDKVKKCSEVVGHARESRDAKSAISQVVGASLMADMGMAEDQGGTIPVLTIGQPYSPCTLSLQELRLMKLAQLQLDTHHRGYHLILKRVSPVVTLAARTWTMVQDQDGEGDDTERLDVTLHNSRQGEDVLDSASHFVIKEPYFTLTDQGEATLRIDHPSDLIVCKDGPNDSLKSASKAGNVAAAEKLAITCKNEGNAALKDKESPLAHAKYTKGLRVARQDDVLDLNPELTRDLRRNRAHVNLLLNQLDEAISDAKASLINKEDDRSKELDSKAYSRAGTAAYALGEFHGAKTYFEEQQKLALEDKNARINLRRIEMRLHEQHTGAYNWEKIKANLSRARPRVDAASFLSNTRIRDSPGRGRGLFATCDISAGEIVMCEKAFCVVWGLESEALTAMTYDVRDDRIRVSPVGLSKSIVQKLLSNPSQIEKVMDLYSDYQGDEKNVFGTEDGPIVDTFRVHDIVSRNAFGLGSQFGEQGAKDASTGLWIWTAYVNHSCIPNVKKEFVGDLMVLRATRSVVAGEEILHSYVESRDYEARKRALMTTWGFECNCSLCAAERPDDSAVKKKRLELASDAEAFVGKENWVDVKRLTISKVQRLERATNDTSNSEVYKDVPRAVRSIQEWLTKASPRR